MAAVTLSEVTSAPSPRARVGLTLATALIYTLSGLSLLYGLARTRIVTSGRSLLTFGGADGRLSIGDLPQVLQATPRGEKVIHLTDVPLALRWLCASPELLAGITICIAGLLTARVLVSIANGQPFTGRVRRHLTVLSAVLISGGTGQGLLDTWAVEDVFHIDAWVPRFATIYTGLGTDLPHWPLTLIVLGMVAAALRLAFAHGAHLQAEVADVI